MKQIPLLQGKALLIEMTEGATNLKVLTVHQGSKSFPSLKYDRPDLVRGFIDLPPGNWRIIGMLSEVTEEEAATIAEEVRVMNQRTKGYRTYNVDQYGNEGYFESAIKSLDSAILAEGYLLESPPAPKCGCTGPAEEGVCDACDEWMTAQPRILDRSRCLLLGREI